MLSNLLLLLLQEDMWLALVIRARRAALAGLKVSVSNEAAVSVALIPA